MTESQHKLFRFSERLKELLKVTDPYERDEGIEKHDRELEDFLSDRVVSSTDAGTLPNVETVSGSLNVLLGSGGHDVDFTGHTPDWNAGGYDFNGVSAIDGVPTLRILNPGVYTINANMETSGSTGTASYVNERVFTDNQVMAYGMGNVNILAINTQFQGSSTATFVAPRSSITFYFNHDSVTPISVVVNYTIQRLA